MSTKICNSCEENPASHLNNEGLCDECDFYLHTVDTYDALYLTAAAQEA